MFCIFDRTFSVLPNFEIFRRFFQILKDLLTVLKPLNSFNSFKDFKTFLRRKLFQDLKKYFRDFEDFSSTHTRFFQ